MPPIYMWDPYTAINAFIAQSYRKRQIFAISITYTGVMTPLVVIVEVIIEVSN